MNDRKYVILVTEEVPCCWEVQQFLKKTNRFHLCATSDNAGNCINRCKAGTRFRHRQKLLKLRTCWVFDTLRFNNELLYTQLQSFFSRLFFQNTLPCIMPGCALSTYRKHIRGDTSPILKKVFYHGTAAVLCSDELQPQDRLPLYFKYLLATCLNFCRLHQV